VKRVERQGVCKRHSQIGPIAQAMAGRDRDRERQGYFVTRMLAQSRQATLSPLSAISSSQPRTRGSGFPERIAMERAARILQALGLALVPKYVDVSVPA
jgi:hypothetical protein